MRVAALAMLLAAASPALALEAAAPLSEEQAVTLALQANPRLRAQRLERHVAEGQVATAAMITNPSLRFDLMHVQESDASRIGYGVGLSWSPPQPVEQRQRRLQAQAHVDEVRLDVADQEWALAAAVRLQHATLIELAEQRRVADDALALRRRVVGLLRQRVAQGGSTRVELNLAALAVLRAQHEADELAVQAVQAQGRLQALLGLEQPQPAAGPLLQVGDDDPLPDAAALWAQAQQQRPALRAAARRVQADEHLVAAEKQRRYPWLQLGGRYRHNGLSNYRDDVQLTVEFTVPVLNQNGGPLQVARALRERDAAQAQAQGQALQQAIQAGCAELSVQRGVLLRAQREALPVLQEHERLMQAAAQGAEVDLIGLLNSEEIVLRGRHELSQARLNYRRLWLQLEAAVGVPLLAAR